MLARNKSSVRLENIAFDQLHAHDRLLVLLKMRGPSTTAELASKLGITGEAVRQQLQRMQDEGLVEAATEVRGRGRPLQVWKLTPAAVRRFPDAHGELTAQLIESIRKTLGEEALERLIMARGEELFRHYAAAVPGEDDLSVRLRRLVSLRNAEGYMAELRTAKDGYLLIENHCPICAAAGACVRLCRSEQDLFSRLLGSEAVVAREEHIINGARRCVYRIRRAVRSTLQRQACC